MYKQVEKIQLKEQLQKVQCQIIKIYQVESCVWLVQVNIQFFYS